MCESWRFRRIQDALERALYRMARWGIGASGQIANRRLENLGLHAQAALGPRARQRHGHNLLLREGHGGRQDGRGALDAHMAARERPMAHYRRNGLLRALQRAAATLKRAGRTNARTRVLPISCGRLAWRIETSECPRFTAEASRDLVFSWSCYAVRRAFSTVSITAAPVKNTVAMRPRSKASISLVAPGMLRAPIRNTEAPAITLSAPQMFRTYFIVPFRSDGLPYFRSKLGAFSTSIAAILAREMGGRLANGALSAEWLVTPCDAPQPH
jgi:hypothetical protein